MAPNCIPFGHADLHVNALVDDEQFSSFLEALAEDDDSADHIPCPSISEHAHLATTPATRILPGLSAQFPCKSREQTAADVKREKERAKNRKNAAAYRERCRVQIKAVEESLESVQSQLDRAKERWQVLRKQQQVLRRQSQAFLHRLNTPHSPQHCQQSAQNAGGNQADLPAVAVDDCNIANPRTQINLLLSNSMHADYSLSSPDGTDRKNLRSYNAHSRSKQMVNKKSPSQVWCALEDSFHLGSSPWDVPQPISSAAHCAPISYALVSEYMLPRALWQASGTNGIVQAIADYQHSVCSTLLLPSRDVCWFCQYPFPAFCLSFSTGVRSPECSLSTSLYLIATRTESLFLAIEHELLTAALDPGYVAPSHPALNFILSVGKSHITALQAPTPPDPKLLEAFCLRCGVNEAAPLALGVDRVIKPLLRAYRARLSRPQWRAVCIQAMHVLQTSLEPFEGNLPKATTFSEQHGKDAGRLLLVNTGHVLHGKSAEHDMHCTGATRSMQWSDLDTALGVLRQQALCSIHSVLTESASEEGEEVGARSLQACHDRMNEVNAVVGIMQNVFMSEAPVVARRFFVRQFLTELFQHDASVVKVTRLQMKLYRQLQLMPSQRAHLAERWYAWCARRKALDIKQSAALCSLNAACAYLSSPSDLSCLMDILKKVEHAAQQQEEAQLCVEQGPETKSNQAHVGSLHDAINGLYLRGELGFEFPGCTGCLVIDPRWPHASSMWVVRDAPESEGADCNASSNKGAEKQHDHVTLPDYQESAQEQEDDDNSENELHACRSKDCSGTVETTTSVPSLNSAAEPLGIHVSVCMHGGKGYCCSCRPACFARCATCCRDAAHSASVAVASSCSCSAQRCRQECMHVPHQHPSACVHRLQKIKSISHACFACTHTTICCPQECMHGARQPLFLGVSGGVMGAVEDAMGALRDVHSSDGYMHRELLVPFVELDTVQNTLVLGAKIDLGLPPPDMMHLIRTAAEEQRSDFLFGCVQSL